MTGAIVFDGSILAGPITGVARALLDPLRAYVDIADRPLCVLVPRGVDVLAELPAGVHVRAGPATAIGRRLGLRRLLRELDASAFHSPVAALPAGLPCPAVATVHDLPWTVPELREPGCGLRHRLAARRAARLARVVITPSAATRADLLAWLGRDPRARIEVVPHGVWPPREPADAGELVGPFLAFGDARARKNVPRVRAAHALARGSRPELPELRMIGPGLDYVPEKEKYSLMRRARAVLQLSLLEGFGLPALEAMHHGVPVLCSDRGSLPEVTRGAALTADPTDEQSMARAMIQIDEDEQLRQRLRARGLERASQLTPDHTANAWRRIHGELCR